jgi:CubicO group peptidase (beta-lactamase class C family)
LACDTARIRRVIDELQSRQANVGVQVAVRAGGRLVYSRGFGFADLEDSARVTPRTLFGVASVTKAVTGLALLKLWERGAFDLDAPIQRYVPTFPVKPGMPITPRLLAAHLAGLRHWGSERGPVLYARHFDDVKDVLPLFQDDTLIAAVGSGYRYSSPGYNVLGAAIEAAAGMPYQQWVVESLIRPLGLSATAFDDVRVVLPRRARRYSFYDLQTFADIDQPERCRTGITVTTWQEEISTRPPRTWCGSVPRCSRRDFYPIPLIAC